MRIIADVFGAASVSSAVEEQVGLVMLARTHPDLRPKHMRRWRLPRVATADKTLTIEALASGGREDRLRAFVMMRKGGADKRRIAAALHIRPTTVGSYVTEARKRGLIE